MEKEEKVVVVLLIMTLSSLLTAYLCIGSELDTGQKSEVEIKKYNMDSTVGEKVFLEAEVLSKHFTYTGEHLLLKVDCNSEVLSVFISKTAGAEALNMSIREGDFIGVTGTISEYKGEKEIKVERKEDIILNNPSQ
jgi:DNA/RNA endonuclease YhcR with UshA esterase domain